MKSSIIFATSTLALCTLFVESGTAADIVAEFTSTNEGWIAVSHSRQNPPWPEQGITARDLSPAVTNGYLEVQDLNNDWQCVAEPTNFLGDWQRFAGVRLGLVTDDPPTTYSLILFLSGSVDSITTNAASFTFPIAGTPSSSHLDLVAPLSSSQWTLVSGSWTNLVKNVQQFWMRMDLNSNVAGELDLLDYVKLVDSGDLSLRIYRAMELEFFAVAGVTNQLQVSGDLEGWKNYGLPFLGDGSQQSRWMRLGDQQQLFFRVVRIP